MTAFRWLHLTDLHFGMSDQAPLWPNVEEVFFNDLELLNERVGPWDLVLFSGDITQRGTKAEFDRADELFQKMWSRFADWGFTPRLLAIPGNHDLARPSDESDSDLLTLLHNWQLPAVQKLFWKDDKCGQRQLVSKAFQPFDGWWKNTTLPKPDGLKSGLLPGDCSASFEAKERGFSVGIVGLNTAFLQLAGGNFERKLALDVRQLHAVCDGHAADWTKQFDVCLLATHHPTQWLSPDSARHFADEIHFPPERFALHLFGHMHEGDLTSVARGGGNERRTLQGCSLFGLEHWGEKHVDRKHGYSLCELKLEDQEVRLRVWPRVALPKPGGGRVLERDVSSFTLAEADGGTNPVVVKRLDARQRSTAGPGNTPAVTPKPASEYDPRNRPFYVPYRQKGDQVIGRSEALAMVRRELSSGRRTAIGQAAVFQGLGGLGKTQLAVEYAYRYRDEYPNGVVWLTADQDIDAQLVDLSVKAGWVAPESEHRLKLEVAHHRLRSYSGCLIVFDNLEQIDAIKGYLPEPPAECHVLATSRTEQADFTYLPIDVLNLEQSLQLLVQGAGRQPDSEPGWDAARQIAASLGGLPLALELAGAYLSRRPVSWQDYLALLLSNLRQALPSRLASLTGHEADLYSTLQISNAVFDEEPRLREVLDVLTWSAAAPMGIDLLAALVGTGDRTELTGALGLGAALRILQQAPGGESYSIHRLVREVRRDASPLADRAGWAASMCQGTGNWFGALREDFVHLARFEAEIDHLREWEKHSQTFARQESSRLIWLQAYPAFHRGEPIEVARRIEFALNEYHLQCCDDRPLLAHLYNDWGYATDALGNPKRALELAEQALEIRRELFGERHPDTATSLNNVAGYYDALGNPKRALELAEQALAIQRELFGERHPDTATSLNNVASYHDALGNPKRALELAERELAIRRELFGERHPDTAISLNNVASYHNALGNPKRALELAEQALAIQRELFGERHPDTATCLSNVAAYQNALGNPKRALELAEQALAIRRELFGERHPDTAISLNNVAGNHNALGNPKRALELAEQALATRRELFGERHPDTALSLNNVASNHNDLGNPKRALELAEQALAIRRELFGERHPSTALSLSNVANYHNALGNPKRALELAEQALAIRRELLGERHADTAASLHNIAGYLLRLGRTQQAHVRAREALAIERQVLGPSHPRTLGTIRLVAQIPGFRAPTRAGSKPGKRKGK